MSRYVVWLINTASFLALDKKKPLALVEAQCQGLFNVRIRFALKIT